MKLNYFFFFSVLISSSIFVSCKKDRIADNGSLEGLEKIAPDGFNYSTTKDLSVSIRLVTNSGNPIQGAVVSVVNPADKENIYFKGISDVSGYVRGKMTVPAYLDTVVINPNYVGLINNAKAYIGKKSDLSAIIGGPTGAAGDIIPETVVVNSKGTEATTLSWLRTDYVYPSPYSGSSDAIVSSTQYPFSLGRPKYLEATPDDISASLLRFANASLPEGTPLTQTHPEYLANTAIPNIVVTETADVWVTFLSEGASYRNSLAYYTYPTGSVPANSSGGTISSGIDKVTLVFPNASAIGSSGGLRSGDKVKLGRFNAGTTIAFVLVQDGWSGSGVTFNDTKFYTDQKFNPETTSSLKKHTVMLYDDVHNLFLMGFEDINRQSGSDNDFNDLVVYATSNPVTAISPDDVPAIDKGNDRDGDGVLNELDEFPDDPTRATTSYYPSKTGWSTLAFEDSWPKTADYDLNDLVVNYRYSYVLNASNEIVELTGQYQAVAAGADYKNGFGVEFPFTYDKVSSVTGLNLQQGTYISRNANGTEAGQTNAVIIPFDNSDNLIKNPNNSTLVNTVPGKEKIAPATATVKIVLSAPMAASALGSAPFNPFLISNQRRGYEVHLPGRKPTNKATSSIFGTEDDKTSAATNVYYLSKNNWPWAVSFPDNFSYPIETVNINDAYPHFIEWARSNGSLYADWFSSTAAGYRNASKIYTK